MKITTILLSVLATFAFASADVTSNLKYGDNNSQVKELQSFLFDKGLFKTSPSGLFGPATLIAVKEYQKSVMLPVSGYVGALTRAKINESLHLVVSTSTQSTPVTTVITPKPIIQYVYIPVVQTATPTPIVQENKYYLYLNDVQEVKGWSASLQRDDVVGFSFVPRATLNGNVIEVKSCYINYYGKNSLRYIFDGKVSFNYTSGDYVTRLQNGENKVVTCIVSDGKEINN